MFFCRILSSDNCTNLDDLKVSFNMRKKHLNRIRKRILYKMICIYAIDVYDVEYSDSQRINSNCSTPVYSNYASHTRSAISLIST